MEEANEQVFKGDLWMARRLRNGVVFLQGHDGEFTFMAWERRRRHVSSLGLSTNNIDDGKRPIKHHRP